MTFAHRRATAIVLASTVLAAPALLAGCASDAPTAAEIRDARIAAAPGRTPQFDRGRFLTFEEDGRLWVFAPDAEGLEPVLGGTTPDRSVSFVGAGPGGRTVRSDDRDDLLAYVAAKPGFEVFADDGRLWVFRADGPAAEAFLASGEPATSVTWIGAGPKGATLRSDERRTLLEYLAARPGFTTIAEEDDGTWRLWIFEDDSEDLEAFRTHGEPAKSVTWIGEGPRGTTLRSGDASTLLRHAAVALGFTVFLDGDGRLWVFRDGSPAIPEYLERGELGASVTRIGAGPRGTTVRSEDAATIDAYLGTLGRS